MTPSLPPPIEIDDALLQSWPLPMPGDGGKEQRGSLLVIAGAAEMPGAARLAAESGLRAGAGKLVIATAATCAPMLAVALPEARVIALPETADGGFGMSAHELLRGPACAADAIVVGPGLQDEAATLAMVRSLLQSGTQAQVVFDALAMAAVTSARDDADAGRATGAGTARTNVPGGSGTSASGRKSEPAASGSGPVKTSGSASAAASRTASVAASSTASVAASRTASVAASSTASVATPRIASVAASGSASMRGGTGGAVGPSGAASPGGDGESARAPGSHAAGTHEPPRDLFAPDALAQAAASDAGCGDDARTAGGAFAGIVTPHAGEMAHLTGEDKAAIEAEPAAAAARAAQRWQVVVVLKGAVTFIASPDGRVWRHEGGNRGLGVSGSGDALAGIIGGLLARGATPEQAAAWGVRLHARAGERLAVHYGELGYLAREIPAQVPPLMHALLPRTQRSIGFS